MRLSVRLGYMVGGPNQSGGSLSPWEITTE